MLGLIAAYVYGKRRGRARAARTRTPTPRNEPSTAGGLILAALVVYWLLRWVGLVG